VAASHIREPSSPSDALYTRAHDSGHQQLSHTTALEPARKRILVFPPGADAISTRVTSRR
jgi:hypothetical protein